MYKIFHHLINYLISSHGLILHRLKCAILALGSRGPASVRLLSSAKRLSHGSCYPALSSWQKSFSSSSAHANAPEESEQQDKPTPESSDYHNIIKNEEKATGK